MRLDFVGAEVTASVRTEPIGPRVEQVIEKCIGPMLEQTDYKIGFVVIGLSLEKIKGKDYKLYKFHFQVSSPTHDVSHEEAEQVVRDRIVPWLDD